MFLPRFRESPVSIYSEIVWRWATSLLRFFASFGQLDVWGQLVSCPPIVSIVDGCEIWWPERGTWAPGKPGLWTPQPRCQHKILGVRSIESWFVVHPMLEWNQQAKLQTNRLCWLWCTLKFPEQIIFHYHPQKCLQSSQWNMMKKTNDFGIQVFQSTLFGRIRHFSWWRDGRGAKGCAPALAQCHLWLGNHWDQLLKF